MRKNQRYAMLAVLFLWLAIPCSVFGATDANYTIRINSGERGTSTRDVSLQIVPPKNATRMRISNNANWNNSYWESVKRTRDWTLDFGSGTKQVTVQFQDNRGDVIGTYDDTIYLAVPPVMNVDFKINDDDSHTSSRHVTLDLYYSQGVEGVAINNSNDFLNVPYIPVEQTIQWVLTPETGGKTVFIRFRDANNNTKVIQKNIYYDQPRDYIPEGSLLKGHSDAVYYYGFDGKLHPFFHSLAFQSYFTSFGNIKYVSNAKLSNYQIAEPVCIRAGTWLLKFQASSRVYAVEPGCRLRPIRSEAEAYLFYGSNWSKRIVELHSAYAAFYSVRELTDEDRENDRDRDGVPKDVEEEYGISDSNKDYDNDGLNDYEEIYFWFTDPTRADSDGDGMKDGKEIVAGRAPNGPGILEEVPENTYRFPRGSVVYKWWDNKKYYYFHQDKFVYFLANKTSDEPFSSNNFQERFILNPPFEIDFEARDGWYILEDHDYIKLPLTTRYKNVTVL